ncbi:LysR family transcriptional regulator [Novosphingobium flavum]|uniref:LysR family transcriptional regulator n=1 Tax=Novosphingobium aerophilum TaxID=2839843 RepID=A0A7X1F614_9SPHN|nr:LysR family transcriptional regulator [Novosphingobium aerophilum]MBC2650889.1 LysR family transcriptional regulator [Novosphingobium aerophilum]MBC2663626.1 LysR family transcriptional regulator [Novosphingobium aerophilum]
MPGLNYNHLRYFWEVARDGNLTRTAARLNVSQSSLSVQIRKLEDRLGHALFNRRAKTLHLTEAGRIALDHANAIFATGDDLLGTLGETGLARETLRVGAQATLSRNFQIGFLRPVFGRRDVELILKSGSEAELLDALRTLNLDVVLSTQPPPTDDLSPFVVHRISEQPVALIGHSTFTIAQSSLAEQLSDTPIVLPARGTMVRTGFDSLVARLGVQPNIVAEVDDMAMMRLLAREGLGLAVLAPIVVADELASGLFVEAAKLPSIVETFYAIVMRRRFAKSALTELLTPARSTVLPD